MKLQILALIAAISPVIGACAFYGSATNATASTSAVQVVEMNPSLTFSPEPLRISAGDTVEFRNVSGFVHTVSTVPDCYRYFCDPHHCAGMIETIVVSAQAAHVIESPRVQRLDRESLS